MKEEIFKEIAGYEGLYQVSNFGNVRRLSGNGCRETRVLKQRKHTNGYLQVNLYKEGKLKTHRVHRLVAQAFIPNPENLTEINHIDEDKTNNRVDNLEWCSIAYNNSYGTHKECCYKKVLQLTLDGKLVKELSSIMECGRNGFSISVVSRCCNNKYGKQGNVYKGYRWMFAKDYYTLLARQNKDIPSSLSGNHDAQV